jgi:hypothetical protein
VGSFNAIVGGGDHCRRGCLCCNADFLVKKKDRKTKQGEGFWINIPEGIGEEPEDYGSGGSPESWSNLALSGDTTSMTFSDVSFPETGAEASNATDGEHGILEEQELKLEGNISPENLERICKKCKSIRNAASHIQPLEEREQAVEVALGVSDEARPRVELSEAANDSTAQPAHQSYSSVGNIPTVEEVIRRQELMDDENDHDPEPPLNRLLNWILSWLLIVVQILLIAPIAIPGAVISILASVIIAELWAMTKLLKWISALTLVVVQGYATFIMDVPRITSTFVGGLIHVLDNSREIVTWMVQRLFTMPRLFLFGLVVLLWAIVIVFPIEIDRFSVSHFRETFDALTLGFWESITGFIIVILELYPRQVFTYLLRSFRALFKATVEIAKAITRAFYNLIAAILGLGFIISGVYQFLADCIYFLRKCTFPNARGTSC